MSAPAILERIRREIRAGGPVPFSRFMQIALYDPDGGYYARGPGRLGPEGDFFTASDAGTVFGECLARQIVEMDGHLGRPEPFDWIEFGAGRGLLARDAIDALSRSAPALAARLAAILVDESAAMRSACRDTVPEALVLSPAEIGGPHVGCVLAVELFDALPVHRIRRRGGRLVEVFVGLGEGDRLIEVEKDPRAEAAALAVRYGAAPEEGDEAEVCPSMAPVLGAMAGAIARGFLLVVDYGYPANEMYGPAHRRGTLLAYSRHAASEEYLSRVGEQDLTAHVNLTHLADEAATLGLVLLGATTQDRFLVANGILERFRDDGPQDRNDPARVKRRLQAMQLLHPEGMGQRFKVLVFSKGLDPPPRLAGVADPFREATRP